MCRSSSVDRGDKVNSPDGSPPLVEAFWACGGGFNVEVPGWVVSDSSSTNVPSAGKFKVLDHNGPVEIFYHIIDGEESIWDVVPAVCKESPDLPGRL